MGAKPKSLEDVSDFYIKNLKILIFLLDKKLFIELLNEVHLFITMDKVIEWFQNSTIFNRKYFKWYMAGTFGKYQ